MTRARNLAREALKNAAPWLGRLIADGGHLKCVAPNHALRTLALVESAIADPPPPSVTEAALDACRALCDAYDRGGERGGSVDWSDVNDAWMAAKGALAAAGEPRA